MTRRSLDDLRDNLSPSAGWRAPQWVDLLAAAALALRWLLVAYGTCSEDNDTLGPARYSNLCDGAKHCTRGC